MPDGPLSTQPSLPAETTLEQDRKTAGQRNINALWEGVQGILAVIVISGFVYNCIVGKESAVLASVTSSIITFYYVRTNHTKTGGVGGTDSR